MTERNENQEISFRLPPAWCGAICRNSMNDVCVEGCAINRDCSAFDPKPGLKLQNMPQFPLHETANMTREERFASVTIYLAKIVDHLNGTEPDSNTPVFERSSRTVQPNKAIVEIASVLPNLQIDEEKK